jgi:hypothetical protein
MADTLQCTILSGSSHQQYYYLRSAAPRLNSPELVRVAAPGAWAAAAAAASGRVLSDTGSLPVEPISNGVRSETALYFILQPHAALLSPPNVIKALHPVLRSVSSHQQNCQESSVCLDAHQASGPSAQARPGAAPGWSWTWGCSTSGTAGARTPATSACPWRSPSGALDIASPAPYKKYTIPIFHYRLMVCALTDGADRLG